MCLHLPSLHPHLFPVPPSDTPPHAPRVSPALSSVAPVFSFPPLVHHLYTLPPPCIVYVRPRPCSVRTVCTVPLIDSINGQKFTIEPQGGGDENGFARGAWDWSMLWKRVPLGDRERKRRKTETEPYRYRKRPASADSSGQRPHQDKHDKNQSGLMPAICVILTQLLIQGKANPNEYRNPTHLC